MKLLQSGPIHETPLQAVDPPAFNARNGVSGLVFILLIALGLRMLLFTGCLGTDDLSIWQLATELSRGNWKSDEILQNALATMRYAPSLATAPFLWAFGNSEYTANLYPLIMSLISVVLAWDITRRMTCSVMGSCAAALAMALASLDVQYATITMPDGPFGGVSLLSIWFAVLGIERDRRSPASFNLPFLISGFLAAAAFSHKLVAAQLCAALGLWGCIMLLQRQIRLNILLIPIGFFIGFFLEHLIFQLVYGDWFHRWNVIARAQENHRAFREEHDVAVLSYFDRLSDFSDSTLHSFPSFALLAMLGTILACVFFLQHRRNRMMCLCTLYMISLSAMRLYELSGTFSYQPRRLVPIAGIAAVMIGFLVGVMRRPRWLGPGIAIVVIGLQAVLLFRDDASEISHEAHTLDAERWIRKFSIEHAEDIQQHGLYIDHRTYKTVYALRGFETLWTQGIQELAGPEGREHPVYGKQPETYGPGGYFFENTRIVNWLAARENQDPRFAIFAQIPDSWRIVGIVEHGMSPSFNSALYRIEPADVPDAGRQICVDDLRFDDTRQDPAARSDAKQGKGVDRFGWFFVPEHAGRSFQLESISQSGARLVVDHQRDEPTRFWSTRFDDDMPPESVAMPGDFIILRWPVHAAAKEDAQSPPTITYKVLGRLANGDIEILYQRRTRLYFEHQDLRAYLAIHDEVREIGVTMTFHTPSLYAIEEPVLKLYESLEYSRPD